MMSFFPLPQLAPDSELPNHPMTDCLLNMLPHATGYGPVSCLEPLTSTFENGDIKNAIYFLTKEYGVGAIMGTQDALYFWDVTDKNWINVSNPNQNYSVPKEEKWSFALFDHYVIAVHSSTVPQIFDIMKVGKFRDLGGNPPVAKNVSVWENFLVLYQLIGHSSRIMWSGLNDIEWWTPGQKSCDYQDFADSGTIQGVSKEINPFIFTRKAIYRGTFIPGSQVVFTFHKIISLQGVLYPEAVAGRANVYFFIADNGIFQLETNGNLQNIAKNKIDNFLFSSQEQTFELFVDPIFTRLYCLPKKTNYSLSKYIFVYDWSLKIWSCLDVQAKFLVPVWLASATLEELDKENLSLDEREVSFDHLKLADDRLHLGVLGENNQIFIFSGKTMEASIVTQKLGLSNGKKHRINFVNPLIDTNEIQLQLAQYENLYQTDNIRWSHIHHPSPQKGIFQCRSKARYHRLKFTIAAGVKWRNFSGYELQLHPDGWR